MEMEAAVPRAGNGGPTSLGSRSKQMRYCGTIMRELMHKKHYLNAWPFYTPVDVKGLGLHDYFDIVTRPMDLSLVQRNLDAALYRSPAEFAADVRLIFTNCYKYNPAGTDVVEMAKRLQEVFEFQMAKMPSETALKRQGSKKVKRPAAAAAAAERQFSDYSESEEEEQSASASEESESDEEEIAVDSNQRISELQKTLMMAYKELAKLTEAAQSGVKRKKKAAKQAKKPKRESKPPKTPKAAPAPPPPPPKAKTPPRPPAAKKAKAPAAAKKRATPAPKRPAAAPTNSRRGSMKAVQQHVESSSDGLSSSEEEELEAFSYDQKRQLSLNINKVCNHDAHGDLLRLLRAASAMR